MVVELEFAVAVELVAFELPVVVATVLFEDTGTVVELELPTIVVSVLIMV